MIDKEGGPHCGPPSCRSASLGSSPIAPFDRLFAGFLLLGRVLELALRHPGYEHIARAGKTCGGQRCRSEEHTSELQSLMRISYAVFCLKKKKEKKNNTQSSQCAQTQTLDNTNNTQS